MAIHYPRKALATLLGCVALSACPGRPGEQTTDSDTDATSDPSGTSDDPTTGTTLPPDEIGPREGPWEVVVDALPFPLADIHQLRVGRREYNDNFANRGVVEVLFDHDDETITIETREFVFGDVVETEQFDRLRLWAFAGLGNPTANPDPATDCSQGVWKDQCAILAYYDGQTQPSRLGMDIRVHLPSGYRGQLFVATEDSLAEDAWPRRGDVKIENLCSGGEIELQAGRADIRMCRDLSPAPTCPPESALACAEFPDGSGSEAWSPDCPCGIDRFGQLLIRAPQPWAANITLDVPGDVWLNTTLNNLEINQPHECVPQISDCAADDCVLDDTDPMAPTAEFNLPSSAAPAGAGFNFSVSSGGCTLIPFAEPGAPWTPGVPPTEELRGLTRVCTDCL